MVVEHEIKEIISNYVKNKYFSYLNSNNIYLINESKIKDILNSLYDEKEFKREIRSKLKEKLSPEEYANSSIENLIFELCSDKDYLINRLMLEISKYQDSKIKTITIVPRNDSELGLSLQLTNYGVELLNRNNIIENIAPDATIFIYKIDQELVPTNNVDKIKEFLQNIKNNCRHNKEIEFTLYIF